MKRIKDNKAITLIALIITIVVLLILAVVAIGAAQESNIVGYAQNASGKYEQAKDNEISLLKQYENKIEEVISGADEYPKVYSKVYEDQGLTFHWIEKSKGDGVLAIVNTANSVYFEALRTVILECNNIKSISNYTNSTVIKDLEYTLVAHNDSCIDLVYSPDIEKWILLGGKAGMGSDGIVVVDTALISVDSVMELNTTMTQEEINSYIEAAQ